MVEDDDVHGLADLCQSACDPLVAVARAWVATGVVVGEDQPAGPVASRVGDDFSHRQVGAVAPAVVAGKVKAAGLVIDMRDPKVLHFRIDFSKAAGKEAERLL